MPRHFCLSWFIVSQLTYLQCRYLGLMQHTMIAEHSLLVTVVMLIQFFCVFWCALLISLHYGSFPSIHPFIPCRLSKSNIKWHWI